MEERRTVYIFGDIGERGDVIETIEREEFEVRAFQNRSAFLVWLDHCPPDVVVIEDRNADELNEGPSFLRRIRQAVGEVPIIVLTHASDVITRGWLFEQGATDFVMMPLVTSELLARLRSSVSHADIQEIIRRRMERQSREATASESDEGEGLSEISELTEFAAELEAERKERSRARRALIVDDDPLTRRMLAAVLSHHGFEVEQAEDGEKGLHAMGGGEFDVVVFELNLPHKNGYQILEAVGSISRRPKMMVLSAESRDKAILRAFDLGADDFVAKPFNPDIIRARAQRLLARPGAVN